MKKIKSDDATETILHHHHQHYYDKDDRFNRRKIHRDFDIHNNHENRIKLFQKETKSSSYSKMIERSRDFG